jgi:hypothetical protein
MFDNRQSIGQSSAMKKPYTIRRRVSDYKWEYLMESEFSIWRGREKGQAENRLEKIQDKAGWKISCCGA